MMMVCVRRKQRRSVSLENVIPVAKLNTSLSKNFIMNYDAKNIASTFFLKNDFPLLDDTMIV